MDREKNRALWPWQCHPERVIPSPLRRAHVLPPVGAQVIKSPVAGALREKLVKYRRYLELRAAERSVGDPYLQALSFVAPKTAAPRSPLPRPPPVRPLRKRVKPASPGSAKTTRPGTRETNSFPEEGRPWTEPGKGRSRPSSRGPGSRDEGSKTRPDIESPLQEIAMALDLWNDALGSHFVRAPNALGWLEAMCGSGQLHSQTELCNVARRLGLSEEDAFRVAVALWALSDGKTLSLQLLVGALEDARELQLLAPDSSSVPLPRHLLGVNDQPEQMEVEVLETATNSGVDPGPEVDPPSEVAAQETVQEDEEVVQIETPVEEIDVVDNRPIAGDDGEVQSEAEESEEMLAEKVQETLVKDLVLRAQQQGRQAAEAHILAKDVVLQAQQRGRQEAEAKYQLPSKNSVADEGPAAGEEAAEVAEGKSEVEASEEVLAEEVQESLAKALVLRAQQQGRQAAEAHLSQVAREVAREAVLQMQRRAEEAEAKYQLSSENSVADEGLTEDPKPVRSRPEALQDVVEETTPAGDVPSGLSSAEAREAATHDVEEQAREIVRGAQQRGRQMAEAQLQVKEEVPNPPQEEKSIEAIKSAKATGKVSMRMLFKMASRITSGATSSQPEASNANANVESANARPIQASAPSTPQPKTLPGRVPLTALFKAKISKPRGD